MVKAKDLLKKTKDDELDEDVLDEETPDKDDDEESEETMSASAKKYEDEEEDEESDDDPSTDAQDETPVRTPGKVSITEEDEEKVRESVNKGVDLDDNFEEKPMSKLSQDSAIKEEKSFSDMNEDDDKMKSDDEALDLPEEIEEKRLSAKEHTLDDLTADDPLPELPEEAGFSSNAPRASGYFKENSDELGRGEDRSSIPHLGSMRNSQPSSLYASNRNPGGGSKWHVIVLALIGIAVVGATVYLLKGNIGTPSFLQSEATPTPEPTISSVVENPTPTPEPTITRADYKVRVLNGTSQSGLAGTTATKLKDLGYQIDKTGNATNSAFTQTVVRVKEGSNSAALFDLLVKDLSSDFSAVASTILKAADAADAEVILGTK